MQELKEIKTQESMLSAFFIPSKSCSFLTAPLPELKFFPDNLKYYESLHKFSIKNRELFWSHMARSRLEWFEDFTETTSGEFTDEDFHLKWFIGGKLNVSGINL